jgi:hypothetical protein
MENLIQDFLWYCQLADHHIKMKIKCAGKPHRRKTYANSHRLAENYIRKAEEINKKIQLLYINVN